MALCGRGSHRNGEKISSGPTSPALGSKRADYFAAAQIDLPTPQPALSPEPPVADAAIDEKSTAGLDPATSSVGQAERLVVRLAANIRSEPSSKSTLIGTANVSAELEAAERQARWIRFVDPATSHTGWIYEGLLTPLRSESAIRPTAASAGKAVSPIANVPRRAVRPAASPRAPKQRVGGRAALSGYAQLPTGVEFPPNKLRFGPFARRRILREGIAQPGSHSAVGAMGDPSHSLLIVTWEVYTYYQ